MQVIARPHFLLVTLVLCNAAATEVCDARLFHLIMLRISRPVLAVPQQYQ